MGHMTRSLLTTSSVPFISTTMHLCLCESGGGGGGGGGGGDGRG